MGQKFNDAMALARKQSRFASLARRLMEKHQDALISAIKIEHQQRTSGRISEKRLRSAGHPFARNKFRAGFTRQALQADGPRKNRYRQSSKGASPAAIFPKLPINRQTGKLQQAINSAKIRETQNERRYFVGFRDSVAPYWKYVLARGGTRHMVPRGYVQEHNKRAKQLSLRSVNAFRKDSYQLYVRLR